MTHYEANDPPKFKLSWIAWTVIVLLGLGLIAGGGEDEDDASGGNSPQVAQEGSSPSGEPEPQCEDLSGPALTGLENGLTTKGGGSLANATVEKVGGVEDFRGKTVGAYVIRAGLKAPGTAGTELTWVADKGFADSGGGFVMGADELTREFSVLGSGAAAGSPAADYAEEAVSQSAGC